MLLLPGTVRQNAVCHAECPVDQLRREADREQQDEFGRHNLANHLTLHSALHRSAYGHRDILRTARSRSVRREADLPNFMSTRPISGRINFLGSRHRGY
jgi:hypothetical protein